MGNTVCKNVFIVRHGDYKAFERKIFAHVFDNLGDVIKHCFKSDMLLLLNYPDRANELFERVVRENYVFNMKKDDVNQFMSNVDTSFIQDTIVPLIIDLERVQFFTLNNDPSIETGTQNSTIVSFNFRAHGQVL